MRKARHCLSQIGDLLSKYDDARRKGNTKSREELVYEMGFFMAHFDIYFRAHFERRAQAMRGASPKLDESWQPRINEMMRGGKLSHSGACNRLANELKRQGVQVTGRTIRNNTYDSCKE